MTVISTVISMYCTAVASDSFIIRPQPDGTKLVEEDQKTKIISVNAWRGTIAYWGLALHGNWKTLEWLKERSADASRFQSAEDFAIDMREKLSDALSKMHFKDQLEAGIGIHFTAYENVNGFYVPELFVLSNFGDTSYNSLHKDGVRLNRNTYISMDRAINGTDLPALPEHRDPMYRMFVRHHLNSGAILLFNNGDPIMFNQAANGILGMINAIADRGNLINATDIGTYRQMAKLPVEIVSKAQQQFAKQGTRLVGGRPHDLVVTPTGIYSSDSGDM